MTFQKFDLNNFESSRLQRKYIKNLLKNKKIQTAVINPSSTLLTIEASEIIPISNLNTELKKIAPKAKLTEHIEKEVFRDTVYLTNLDCANCALKIEGLAKKMIPNEKIIVDFATTRFIIETTDEEVLNDLVKRVEVVAHIIDPNIVVERKNQVKIKRETPVVKKLKIQHLLMIIGAILLATAIIFQHVIFKDNSSLAFIYIILYIIAYLLVGYEVLISFVKNILHAQFFDEKFLMSVASIGAIATGQFIEAVLVMLLYQIGEWLQDKAVNRSRDSISELLKMEVSTCHLKVDASTTDVDVETIMPGDIIVVLPNEVVPVDSKIISGNTYFDTKSITGESEPVYKKTGEEILSGFVNTKNMIEVKVLKPYNQSMIKKITELVEDASIKKAKAEDFITKFARGYTPIVVGLAIIIAVVLPLIYGPSDASIWRMWIHKALTFLVISCPCSVVISVPLAFFVGIGLSSKRGILIKGSNYLEVLSKVDTVVFDKTGTLTKGTFEVVEIIPQEGYDEQTLLKNIAYAEYNSVHPIGVSIVDKYGKDQIIPDIITNFAILDGLGIKADVNGSLIEVGNQKFIKEFYPDTLPVQKIGTTLYAFKDKKYIGCVIVGDIVKEEAYQAMIDLKAKKVTRTIMLTGDHKQAGEYIANMLQMTDVYTDLLPDQKVEIVQSAMKTTKNKVAYIGDGVNDAPVIAASDIGIAMGETGSDVTIQVADAVIMSNNLRKVAEGIDIAKATRIIVLENIIFSLLFKLLVLILDMVLTEGIPLWLAVISDVGVCLLTILNSMRLYNKNKKYEKRENIIE